MENENNAMLMKLLEMVMRDYRKEGDFFVREIYPGVYRFLNAGVHMDLFVGTERALLFDTGNGYADLYKAVREVTKLPLTVVNSHGHLDHSCGNYQFEQEIYIHPDDMELCRQHNSREIRSYSAAMASAMKDNPSPMGGVSADFDAEFYASQGCGNLVPVREGHVFQLGGKALEVVELPGHTKGSIGLLYQEEKVLFSGDAINNNLYLFWDYCAPLSVYQNSIRKALGLDFKEMVVSHGFTPIPRERLNLYLALAEDPDFEHGIPFKGDLVPEDADVRQCVVKGQKPDDCLNPEYACIVLSRENLEG